MSSLWLEPPPGAATPWPGDDPVLAGFDLVASLRQADARGSPSAAARTSEYEDALYAWGVCRYEAGVHDDADAVFQHLCRLRPGSARLLKALAANHLARGDDRACAAVCERALATAPADAETLFCAAQAALRLGDYPRATDQLRAAQALASAQPQKWPELARWCAELLERLTEPDGAVACPDPEPPARPGLDFDDFPPRQRAAPPHPRPSHQESP